jgi:peptide/nickel transport system permease protein
LPDPKSVGVAKPGSPMFGDRPLGTDQLGRDILARTVYGARISLIVGFSAVAFGLIFGGALGIVAGFFRGKLEIFIMGAMDVLLAFPALILALAIVTFMGQSLRNVVLAIGILSIAPIARIIRASTLVVAQREFVLAARTLGAKNSRIIFREVLPNVLLPALSFSLIGVAVAIVAEGALAFLGLSVAPPTPTWGGMINEGRVLLEKSPHISFVPSGAMLLTVLSLNFAGDRLRSFFDARDGS